MIRVLLSFVFLSGTSPMQMAHVDESASHLDFSVVHGSAGYVPKDPNGMMEEAPYTVLSFTMKEGHKTLIMTDMAGDYNALLQPGYYCLSAYDLKTGDRISIDPKQMKCFDVRMGRDVRLDVMLKRAGGAP
ncbi:MAG: hypothetical protein ABR905_01130 [Terracidiphilus sp.]|jgi:hypothetical protein